MVKVYYKVARKQSDGSYVSVFAAGEWQQHYRLGEVAISKVGHLFAFEHLRDVNRWVNELIQVKAYRLLRSGITPADDPSRYCLMAGKGELAAGQPGIETIQHYNMMERTWWPLYWHDPSGWVEYFRTHKEKFSIFPLPVGTVFLEWFEPIKIMARS